MQPRHSLNRSILLCLTLALLAPAASAKETYGTLTTVLNTSALQPGRKAVIAVVFDVKEGFHTQSHTPTDANYKPFLVELTVDAAFKAGDPAYPKGEIHDYPKLAKLDVYTGKVVVYVPIELKADAALGELKITGAAKYQACNNEMCFFPTTNKFEIVTKIVPATEAVTANEPDLFKDYNPAGATTKPSTQPAKSSPAADIKAKSQTTWGDWFQKPWFVWPVTVILVLMALGMFGLFTFRLPLGVYTIEPKHDTYSGNFLFGILTAVLSTPCTAPLFPGILAWAVLQAKSGGRFIGVGAIAMVGVGMALPYLILSGFPELARRIPRTGPWSELVKQFMGFLILAVAAYFAGQQVLKGNEYMWLVFAVACAGGLFLIIRTRQLMPRARPLFIAVLLAIAMSYGSFTLAQTLNSKSEIDWQHYSDATLAEARASKKIALVKFTASWCANCQYIETTVYHEPAALAAVKNHDVIMIKADLSKEDAPGIDLVATLNPGGGIPLTAIYSPLRSEPYMLKSIYRTPTLIAALDAAAKGEPFNEEVKNRSATWAFSIALLVGVIFNAMPCVLPVLPLKAIGFYEVSQHNRLKSLAYGSIFSLGIIATFAVLALLVLPVAR